MFKAVIFDMDGVIIDSEIIHNKSLIMTFAEYGVSLDFDYLDQFIGTTATHTFSTIKNDFHISASIEELLEKDSIMQKKIFEEEGMRPLPGVINLIKELHRNNIKMAVASSSAMEKIENVTKAFGIYDYFDTLISGENILHSKPAPDIFLKALSQLTSSAEETIVIEDSKNGTLAAKAAGIPCIGFINPNSGKQDLSAAWILTDSFYALSYTYLDRMLSRRQGLPVTIHTTKHLCLRELTKEDFPALYEIYQNPEVCQYIDGMNEAREVEEEKFSAYLKNIYPFYDYGLWGVFEKNSHSLIGHCGLQNQTIDNQAEIEISYLIAYEYWKQGYGFETCQAILAYAAKELELSRIVAAIDAQNIRSLNLAKKLGMKKEKKVVYRNRTCDLYVINPISRLHQNATLKAKDSYRNNPDTSVYSKRYSS